LFVQVVQGIHRQSLHERPALNAFRVRLKIGRVIAGLSSRPSLSTLAIRPILAQPFAWELAP
jgi:hypothetical protein